MTLARIKTGDTVQAMAGREKGKTGKVIAIFLQQERALVEGLNKVKRHLRQRSQRDQGGILEKEAPLPLSALMPFCPKCNRGVRLRFKWEKEKGKIRVCVRCGEGLEVKPKQ